MRWTAPVFALTVLGACTAASRDAVARNAAREAVRPVLAQRLPGVPAEPAVNCIIDNATADELITLAAEAALGPTERSVSTVNSILRRPETLRCLASDGLPVLLGQL